MAEKNLFIYILVRLGLEPYNICTNPETGETPLEGRLCVYILQAAVFCRRWELPPGVYKKMSSISADQKLHRIWAQMRRDGGGSCGRGVSANEYSCTQGPK